MAELAPLLDLFKRGGIDRDIRLMVARRELGLRPHEQLGLLELLAGDADAEVARIATDSLRATADAGGDAPAPAPADGGDLADGEDTASRRIASMNPAQRLALAMRGTREERAILVRDPNRIVAVAVLSSPRTTDAEVERIARMANVSEDVLRIIGQARGWAKHYPIVAALTKNPRTPVAVSLTLLSRLHESDVKALATDRNVPDVIRLAARRRLAPK